MKTRAIKVNEDTYEMLKSMGTMGDTFNSVISKLLEIHRNQRLLDESL